MLILAIVLSIGAALSTCDEIETNGVSIQMRIETTNTNVLISGTNGQVYTLIQSNELVTITCGKTNCNDGFLAAFYNGARVAKQGPCANFADASSYTDYKCLYQTFQAILRVESSTHLIECRYDAANSTDSVKFTITKIYPDSVPRLRIGSMLESSGVISVNLLTSTRSVSCEAITTQTTDYTFDSLQWFTTDTNINLHMASTRLTFANINVYGYTSSFQPSNYISGVQGYKCCTVRAGVIVRCQATYLVVDASNSNSQLATLPFTSATTTTTSAMPTVTATCVYQCGGNGASTSLPCEPCSATYPCSGGGTTRRPCRAGTIGAGAIVENGEQTTTLAADTTTTADANRASASIGYNQAYFGMANKIFPPRPPTLQSAALSGKYPYVHSKMCLTCAASASHAPSSLWCFYLLLSFLFASFFFC